MAPQPEADAAVRWLTDQEQRAWRAYINGTRRLLDRLERDLKVHGLSHDDYGVLVALSESEGGRLRMAELADQSVESRSRLSHHIGRMEAAGLVRREQCPNDRRGFFAVLTPEGRALMEETAPHHVAGVRGAGRILAINRDVRAPIFQFSDVGYVADLEVVLPALVSKIKEWRDAPGNRSAL